MGSASGAIPPSIVAPMGFSRVGFWVRACAMALDLVLIILLTVASHFPPVFLLAWAAYHIGMWTWKGTTIGGRSYKVHLDGYDLGPALRGQTKEWPRKEFIYWTDDGSVAALRYGDLKVTFLEQDGHGLRVWQDPFKVLRAPLLTNLRMDPFERAEYEHAMGYQRWYVEHMWAFAPAGAYVGNWLQSFKEFPPRQKPGSFNLERVMDAVTNASKN